MHEVIVDLPVEYQGKKGSLKILHEEDALSWLWAFPSLMPWERSIVWLYTPVVGNKKWPGDLWGVDSAGDLLILECKQCRRSDDPFKDFLAYHVDGRDELSAIHWMKKFPRHLKSELDFPDGISERPSNKTNGILPRSNKRAHIRRWPMLAKKIDSQIRSPRYKTIALSYLGARSKANDPTPHYLALMVVSNANSSVLSQAAISSGQELQKKVDTDHVGVVLIQAKPLFGNRVRITTTRLSFNDF